MAKDDALATQIYEDIGVYLAHTIPFYAKFYDIKHMLLLGRVMGGKGGDIILATCKVVVETYYVIAVTQQPFAQVRTYKAGASCN